MEFDGEAEFRQTEAVKYLRRAKRCLNDADSGRGSSIMSSTSAAHLCKLKNLASALSHITFHVQPIVINFFSFFPGKYNHY